MVRSKLALARLSVGLLGHISVLVVRTTFPASACCNVGSVTSDCNLIYFSLLRVELYMLCVVELCYVPVVPRLDLLIMYAGLVPLLCYD